MSNYKFYITDGTGTTEVFPLGFNNCKFVWEKNKNIAHIKIKFSGKLKFINNAKQSIADFDYFYTKDQGDTRCEEMVFTIKRQCNGGSYENFWIGVFEVVEGDMDIDSCTFSVTPRLKEYIFEDKEINFIDVPGSFSVNVDADIASNTRAYPRCKNLSDTLTYFATNVSSGLIGIVSDFFQINPVTVSARNYVTNTTNRYTKLALASLSEIQEPLPSNPSTIEKITFKKLMDDLMVLFHVHWFVDENLNIRIEHYKYFDGVAGIDLTIAQYEKWMVSSNKYSYDEEDTPKTETWTTLNSISQGKIIYGECGDLNKNETVFSTTLINVDYYHIFYESGGASSPGLFLFATQTIVGQRWMYGARQNEELVIPRLVLRFHRHGRPLKNATFEYTPGPFDFTLNSYGDLFVYSEKPVRKQVNISFPLCCDDVEIVASNYMTTGLGNGYIQNSEFNPKTNMFLTTLKYKLHEDQPDIIPTDLSGLDLWLKSDTGITLVSGKVSAWADQSGNGRNAVQGTDANRPIMAGSQVSFSGTTYLTTPSFQLFPLKRGSIFIVHRKDPLSIGSNSFLSTQGGSGNFWDLGYKWNGLGSPNDEHRYYNFNDLAYYPAEGFVSNINKRYAWGQELNLFEVIRHSDTEQTIWLNGKPVDAANGNDMTIADVQISDNPLFIGDNPNIVGVGCNGEIAEIIVFDRELTSIERQQIENYLSKKWAFNLYHIS